MLLICYFFPGRCANALPAAVLLAFPVAPLRRTFDAAFAARALVTLPFAMPLTSSHEQH
jgi:hypothetical protein